MIARCYIKANLTLLNRRFTQAGSANESLLFSKLAVLELCGWVEESMDEVIRRCAIRQLRDNKNRKYVEKQIIGRTYGFDYEKHFRKMLIQLVGIINVERIEKSVDTKVGIRFRATLDALVKPRNSEAHTHIRGVARTINAPSVTLRQFGDLYDGLKEYDRVVRGMRL